MPLVLLLGLPGLRGLKGISEMTGKEYGKFRDRLYELGRINVHTPISTIDTLAKLEYFKTNYLPKILTMLPNITEELLTTLPIGEQEYLANAYDIEEEFEKKYNPYKIDYVDKDGTVHYVVDYTDNGGNDHYVVDPNKGMGNELDYLKYKLMTPEGKKALLDSKWRTSPELRKKHEEENKRIEETNKEIYGELGHKNFLQGMASAMVAEDNLGYGSTDPNKISKKDKLSFELVQQLEDKRNQKIIEKIMSDDLTRRRAQYTGLEELKLQEYNNMGENEVYNRFNSSLYDEDGFGNELFKVFFATGNLNNFGVEEQRKYLAMRDALKEGGMDPLSALEFLINYAKDYISDHTGKSHYWNTLAKDILLSAASYSADKVNGLVGFAKMMNPNKYDVFVDDLGNAYSLDEVVHDGRGNAMILDEDGNPIYLHKTQMTSSLLYAQGKGTDGKDKHWILNNKFWDNVELYGTMNENLLKYYAKSGYSPDKIVYKAGDESDLFYETAKMTSFGIADGMVTAGLSLIGGGLGMIGNSAKVSGALGKIANGAATAVEQFARWGGPTLSTAGIANAYARGTYQENVVNNLNKLDEYAHNNANDIFIDLYKNDTNFKKKVDSDTKAEFNKLKADFDRLLIYNGAKLSKEEYTEQMNRLFEQAANNVASELIETNYQNIKNHEGYTNAVTKATEEATIGALVAGVTDALKYLPVNFAGHRAYLYKSRSKLLTDAQRSVIDKVKQYGKDLRYHPDIWFANAKDKARQFGKFAGKQAFGGAWTNYTDELHTAGGRRLNDDAFSAYLNGDYDGEAVNSTYSLGDAIWSYFEGARQQIPQESALRAGLVGALGSVFSFAPNFEGIGRLAFSKDARNQFMRQYEALRKGTLSPEVEDRLSGVTQELLENRTARLNRGAALLSLANTFLNNGVLLEYEAKKLAEGDVLSALDGINKIVKSYDDFEDVEDVIALDLADMDATNEQDKKVIEFLKALKAIHLINKLATTETKNTDLTDALFAKSLALQNAKQGWEDILKLSNGDFTQEEAQSYIDQFYNANEGVVRSKENDAAALLEVQNNAKSLIAASKIYELGLSEVDEINKERMGENKDPIDSHVAEKIIQRKALSQFLEDEINEFEKVITGKEITDYEESTPPIESFGSRLGVLHFIKGNELAIKNLLKHEESNQKEIDKNKKALEDFIKEEFETEGEVNADTFKTPLDLYSMLPLAQKDEYNKLLAKYDASKRLLTYLSETREKLERRNSDIQKSLSEDYADGKEFKVLSANEILSLPVEARALMLNSDNNKFYSRALILEIAKAKKMIASKLSGGTRSYGAQVSQRRNGTPSLRNNLDNRTVELKIMDLATLVRHKLANDKAYEMMKENPDAAYELLDAIKTARGQEGSYSMIDWKVSSMDKAAKMLREGTLKKLGKTTNQAEIDSLARLEKETMEKLLSMIHPTYLKYALDNIDRFPNLMLHLELLQDIVDMANLKTTIQKSIENNSDLKPEEQKQFKFDVDNLLKDVTNKSDAIDVIKEAIQDIRRSYYSAKDAKEKGVHAFMEKAYNTLLNNILEIEKLKNSTAVTTEEEQKKRDLKQLTRKNTILKSIQQAESIPLNETSSEGVDHIGSYRVDVINNTTWNGKELDEAKRKASERTFFNRATLTHEGDPSTMWSLSGEELSKMGITPQLILGEPSNWENNPLLYDTLKESIPKGNITIESMTIDKDGKVSVNLGANDTVHRIEGLTVLDEDAASKIFDHFTNGLKPLDFILKEQKKIETQKNELSKQENTTPTNLALPQEGMIEDTNYEGTQVEQITDTNLEVTNEEADIAMQGEPNVELVLSPTLDEQSEEAQQLDTEKSVIVDTLAKDTTDNGNKMPENNAFNMLGNPFYLYDVESLKDPLFRKLKRRIIDKEFGLFEKAIKWLDINNVKLLDIIDNELNRILLRTLKIHFLKFKIENKNAFNDDLISDLCPLCVEYTLEIALIHDSSMGGVFKVGNKEYLMVGIAGFAGKNNYNKAQADAYRAFLFKRKVEAKQYLDGHPNERAYVNPNIYTEVQYITSGRLVGETEADEGRTVRSITELLDGPEKATRNPNNLTLRTLKWMILEGTKALFVNFTNEERLKAHTPIDAPTNKGAVFAMVPGCNGHYLPVYINPVTFDELKDSDLKSLILDEIMKLTSPDHEVRDLAIRNLCKMLVLNDDKNIWVGDASTPVVSIKNRNLEKKFNLVDTNFKIEDFMKAINDTGFRVNITQSVLLDNFTLEMYAEAGAFNTDIAILGAANASYSVYLIGELQGDKWIEKGTPIKKEIIDDKGQEPLIKENLQRQKEKLDSGVSYNNQFYRKRGNDWVFINKETGREEKIEDPRMKKQLDLTSYIRSNELTPDLTKTVNRKRKSYYIIDNNTQSPRVLEVNNETDTIVDLSAQLAIAIIEEVLNGTIQESRDDAAKLEVDRINKLDHNGLTQLGEATDVELDLGEETLTLEQLEGQFSGNWGDEGTPDSMSDVDLDLGEAPSVPETPQLLLPKLTTPKKLLPSPPILPPKMEQKSDGGINSSKVGKTAAEVGAHSIASIMRTREVRNKLVPILEAKGLTKKQAMDLKYVTDWLQGKKNSNGDPIPVDNITDIDTWLSIIEECR